MATIAVIIYGLLIPCQTPCSVLLGPSTYLYGAYLCALDLNGWVSYRYMRVSGELRIFKTRVKERQNLRIYYLVGKTHVAWDPTAVEVMCLNLILLVSQLLLCCMINGCL